MQAVVLAGGYSSRFYPYSQLGHKTMVKIMGKPILEYTLEGLKEAGIKDVIIRVSEDGIIKSYFGNGSKLGISIRYIEQKEALGMGEVLLNAEKFLTGNFILIGGNHVNCKELTRELISSKKSKSKGVVLVKERENPWDYGVVEIKDGKLVRIIEKPKKGEEPSRLGLVSAFLLPKEIIGVVKKAKVYEFNLEEKVLVEYAKENALDVVVTANDIGTLKYPWDLLALKDMLMKNMKGRVDKGAKVSENAEIDSDVIVEMGAEIMEGAKIKGPSYIGKGVKIGTNALVRNGADLEENVSIGAFAEVRNSILMEGAMIHSGFVGDSIIGRNCKIGSGFTTANKKIDRGNIEVLVKGEKVDTRLTRLGTIVGNGVKIGIRVSTMPGVVIGNNAVIGPSTSVFKNVPDDSKFYTKFAEIVEKN
ncbi:MAG: NTP transferase domain-containing protein [Candidatus Levybacteria bacterium]|nr:NTP transferase domain-containing protein [Candidatus Levybacteria bacterium]